MLVRRRCILPGYGEREREIAVDPVRLREWDEADPATRPNIQDAFPDLSADDREFLFSGILPEEWEEICAEDDEEEGGDHEAAF